jgi:YgiT-type zinc finger domain-containing protein
MEKRFAEPPMICLVCRKAQLIDGLVSIDFERDEFKTVINLVPAQVCPACGESYLDEGVTIQVLNQAEEILHQGMLDIVQDYV